MKQFHTGYFITDLNLTKGISNIDYDAYKKQLKILKKSQYRGSFWEISFQKEKIKNRIEFIISTQNEEKARRALQIVFASSFLVDGTNIWNDLPNEPIELNKKSVQNNTFISHVEMSSESIPSYFRIASLLSKAPSLETAAHKYQLSCQIQSMHYMDLDPRYGEKNFEKRSPYPMIHVRFAYAIIAAYSVIEELGLDIIVKKDQSSRQKNGEWDQEVLSNLKQRLEESNINCEETILWLFRGTPTSIENKRIKTLEMAEWADGSDNRDSYIDICDAISQISFLRSKISSHKIDKKASELSVLDVNNAQHLARRLILEKIGAWKRL
jgi:hypothetical protein